MIKNAGLTQGKQESAFVPCFTSERVFAVGGVVGIVSDPDVVTTVEVNIPMQRLAAMTTFPTPIGVMLVDDHKTMLWGLEKLIEGQHFRMNVVGTACTCEEALARVEALLPDVILLDLDLDGDTSLDIVPALLKNGVSRVLVFTGSNDRALLDTAVLRGARGVLRKDVPSEQVIKAIEKVHQGELWLDSQMLTRAFNAMMTPLSPQKPDTETKKQQTLTLRERTIVASVVAAVGAPNKKIAGLLNISDHTLRNNLTVIYQKLEVSNRLELYIYAVKHKLGA